MNSFWVSLNGWSKDREIRVQDGYAFFEVAEQGHCGICRSRIDHIRSVAPADTKYAYLHDRYPSDGKTLWAGIPVTEEMSTPDIVKLFKEKLSLPISRYY